MAHDFAKTSGESGFGVVVPVKRLSAAKTRLSSYGPERRRLLSRAFLLDTLEAALAVPAVRGVVVVTDDEELAGAVVHVGVPGLVSAVPDPRSGDLNAAFRAGAARLTAQLRGVAVVGLCGDLPALTAADLALVLEKAPQDRAAFVRDRHGYGTTAYYAPDGPRFTPQFGADSARLHRGSGAVDLSEVASARVRSDVDTPEDLEVVVRLGVGRHTDAVLAAAGERENPDAVRAP